MVFSPTQYSFSLEKMEAGDLGCFRGWLESTSQQRWRAQNPCVGSSALEPVPSSFTSHVDIPADLC